MTYKALNTFIDDIFAFVIKMPTMYRIGCFRDDIVFFIFLYQRYIYKEDKSRVNEFGFSGDMLEEKDETTQENGDTKALENQEDEEKKDETTQENGDTKALENQEDEEKEEGGSLANTESLTEASGPWKNTQKQKSK